MALQKKLQETKYGLKSFWFGSGFIYARLNLNQYIGLGRRRSVLPYYFLFLSYGLNTKFEHRRVNTGYCGWRLK